MLPTPQGGNGDLSALVPAVCKFRHSGLKAGDVCRKGISPCLWTLVSCLLHCWTQNRLSHETDISSFGPSRVEKLVPLSCSPKRGALLTDKSHAFLPDPSGMDWEPDSL